MTDPPSQLERLVERLRRLDAARLEDVERLVGKLEKGKTRVKERVDESLCPKDWPHAPLHRLGGRGTYLVTAGTFDKEHFFQQSELLDLLENELLAKAREYGWQLEA